MEVVEQIVVVEAVKLHAVQVEVEDRFDGRGHGWPRIKYYR
jgi:hypothetical protein